MTEAFPPPSNAWQKQCWTSLTAQLLLHALLKVMFCKAASCLGMLVLYDSLLSTELKADCRLSVHGASSRATKCTFTPVLTAVLLSNVHITPVRASRALSLRYLANRFGLDMDGVAVSFRQGAELPSGLSAV